MVFSADVTPPSDPDPAEGEMWLDANSGIAYIRTADGLWVEGGAAPGTFPSVSARATAMVAATAFPPAPNIGDYYTFGTRTWRWNGTGWQLPPAGGGIPIIPSGYITDLTGTVHGRTQIWLNWTPVPGSKGTVIYRSRQTGTPPYFQNLQAARIGYPGNLFKDGAQGAPLDAGREYIYRAVPYYDGGEGAFPPDGFIPPASAPVITPPDPDVDTWVASVGAAGGTVSPARQMVVNNFVVGLKTDGIFSKLDRLWLFAAENQPSALLDLITNSTAAVVVYSTYPRFATDRGFTGPSIDTNYNPLIDGLNYGLNSACAGVWDTSQTQGDYEVVLGSYDDVNFGIYGVTNFGGSSSWGLNDGASDPGVVVAYPGPGFYMVDRPDSTSVKLYYNGDPYAQALSPATAIPNLNIDILKLNWPTEAAHGLNSNSVDEIAAVVIGGSLTLADHTNLYKHLHTYMAAVGAIPGAQIPLVLQTDIPYDQGYQGYSNSQNWGLSVLPAGQVISLDEVAAQYTVPTDPKMSPWTGGDLYYFIAAQDLYFIGSQPINLTLLQPVLQWGVYSDADNPVVGSTSSWTLVNTILHNGQFYQSAGITVNAGDVVTGKIKRNAPGDWTVSFVEYPEIDLRLTGLDYPIGFPTLVNQGQIVEFYFVFVAAESYVGVRDWTRTLAT